MAPSLGYLCEDYETETRKQYRLRPRLPRSPNYETRLGFIDQDIRWLDNVRMIGVRKDGSQNVPTAGANGRSISDGYLARHDTRSYAYRLQNKLSLKGALALQIASSRLPARSLSNDHGAPSLPIGSDPGKDTITFALRSRCRIWNRCEAILETLLAKNGKAATLKDGKATGTSSASIYLPAAVLLHGAPTCL
ncbi:hypothetical protein BDW75DRAFT_238942 [Aspergillus navahoensis]